MADQKNYREELAKIMVNHHNEYEDGTMPIAVRSLDQVIKQLQSNQVKSPNGKMVGLKTETIKNKSQVKPGSHNLVMSSPIMVRQDSPVKLSGRSTA